MDDNLPTPLEGLKETGPTPFLTKTYKIVEDLSTNNIVSWSTDNNSFIVWKPKTFALIILPRCFKHNNFSSFVSSIFMWGFKKIDTERWEFANEYFLRGQRQLLKNIKRRKTSFQTQQTQTQTLEEYRFGLEKEIQGMRKERVAIVIELMRLRRKQETVKAYLQLMEEKLKLTQMKQEMMMDFLLRTIKNPSLHSLKKCKHQETKNREEMQEIISSHEVEDHENFIKVEPEENCNGHELHMASMEDQGQDEVEIEMDNEGIWKSFVLTEEMCFRKFFVIVLLN